MILAHAEVGRNIKSAMENKKGKIEVSQKAIIVDKQGKILAIRRTKSAPSRPLYWDLPGGDLDFGEDVKNGIIREIKEETGLDVQGLVLSDVISGFNDRNEFWVTICYLAKPISVDVVLSFEHDNFKWVKPGEFIKLKVSPRNKKFVKKFAGNKDYEVKNFDR